MSQRNEIRERSYRFAVRIVGLARALSGDRVGYVVFCQILRCGTSIGANEEEAQAAQSRKDFISKLSIARKEARETHYWLRLLGDSNTLPASRLTEIANECEELLRMLTAIIKSTKGNSNE